MTTIRTTIHIDQPPERLYDFVTTPGNWPQWHPSSLGVRGDVDHSLDVGESCTEAFRVAGREGEVVWTVKERLFPERWVIDGRIVGRGNGGVITYTLTPTAGGTRFDRVFVYDTPGLLFALLDRLLIRRRVREESTTALRRLKALMEQERVTPSA